MLKTFVNIARDEEGAAMVEYGLLVGLIAVACITATKGVATAIQGVFNYISTLLAAV
ncbi:MAG: Flp family type IVb pilin [Candidatus Eremiobacteraeota bacterium]|nr:Flp family type IVb pilin [Candidatus Eremiobacteraeota bacterium]